jgi:hypothetical protein
MRQPLRPTDGGTLEVALPELACDEQRRRGFLPALHLALREERALELTTDPGLHDHGASIWREPEDLKRFVRSPEHLRIMREYRTTGALYTNAWTAERFDPGLIWKQGTDRLAGRVEAVAHH